MTDMLSCRENALRETRRLQAEIMAEREKFQALRG